MRGLSHLTIRGFAGGGLHRALVIGGAAAMLAGAVPAAAQGGYSPYDDTASAALARYVRTLATEPQDFGALIGAGRAAVELGDAQAAAGFFARADEVNPRSPSPHAGMAAVAVLNGEPLGALPYFKRAQQLGAPVVTFACDRGLAFDLLGRQAEAQADYRMALSGPDAEEARRRLALSLAISGNRAEALSTLGPLMTKGDAGAARARAFVLALSGDHAGARMAIDSAMPGQWPQVEPFVRRLAALKTGEKAAAVNLGIFPDSGSLLALGDVSAPMGAPVSTASATVRLPAPIIQNTPAYGTPQVRAAVAQTVQRAPSQAAAGQRKPRVWLQLAAGADPTALSAKYRRIKNKIDDLSQGITPYVAQNGDKARLVIGPFRGTSDADIFAEDLGVIGVPASRWTNSETDRIVPLGS